MGTKDWNGLCPAGRHGLDFKGQPCDLCRPPRSEDYWGDRAEREEAEAGRIISAGIRARLALRLLVSAWESGTSEQVTGAFALARKTLEES